MWFDLRGMPEIAPFAIVPRTASGETGENRCGPKSHKDDTMTRWIGPLDVALALLTGAIFVSDDPKVSPPLVYRIF